LRWQLDLVIGAFIYVMADFGAHLSASGGRGLSAESLACRLVQFAAAGMKSLSGGDDYMPATARQKVH